jgi:hypothetical protein
MLDVYYGEYVNVRRGRQPLPSHSLRFPNSAQFAAEPFNNDIQFAVFHCIVWQLRKITKADTSRPTFVT